MSEAFDPYLQWLGIRDAQRPPNHYALMGVTLFEEEPTVLTNAADRQMSHVRRFQAGKNSKVSQQLLNEIATAKVCLLNPEKKAAYDALLREQLGMTAGAPLMPSSPMPPEATPAAPAFAEAVPPEAPAEAVLAASPILVEAMPPMVPPIVSPAASPVVMPVQLPPMGPPGRKVASGRLSRSTQILAGLLALIALTLLGSIIKVTLSNRVPKIAQQQTPDAAATPQDGSAQQGAPTDPDASLTPADAAAGNEADANDPNAPAVGVGNSGEEPASSGGDSGKTEEPGDTSEDDPAGTAADPTDTPEDSGMTTPEAEHGADPTDPSATSPDDPDPMAEEPAIETEDPTDPDAQEGPDAAPAEPIEKRKPQPDEAAVKEAIALIRDLFHDEYEKARTDKSKDLAARTALTRLLQQKGNETREDEASRFALFLEARDQAIEASDLPKFRAAVDSLAREYQVDPSEMLVSGVQKLSKKLRDQATTRGIAEEMMSMARNAADREQYESAVKIAEAALSMSRHGKDPPQIKRAVALSGAIAARRSAYESFRKAEAALKASPDDPEANLQCGKHYCLNRNDWERGLAMLCKGSSELVRAAAEAELDTPADAASRIALADLWWEAGEKESDKELALLAHKRAGTWYQQSFNGLSGLMRLRVEKRLSELKNM